MIHRTFRSLDDAPRLVGFTVKQWASLILGTGAVLGVIYLAHVPARPAISLCVFLIGLPAALTYVSENGGLQLSVLLRSMWRWRWSTHTLSAEPGESRAQGLLIFGEDTKLLEDHPGEESSLDDEDAALWERWG
ncbi:MAG TPA: PrgI family protein [Solirubrobacteraceae bacterium]|nr:PrgI family protein [Solirubrobacteraceae bacterium]